VLVYWLVYLPTRQTSHPILAKGDKTMALHPLQTKKFTHMFGFQDADKNGYMEMSDHLLMAARACELRGLAEGSPKAQAIWSKTEAIGQMFMQNMDHDQDGKVSLAEWLQFHEQMLSAPRDQYLGGVYGGIQMMLDLADADGDEQLNLDEYEIFVKVFGISYEDVPSNFAKLDLNKDGFISKVELMALMDQWYTSTNPSEPGNYLAGPLP
jgi:Ca2+-binding EF-hand superfamily protein